MKELILLTSLIFSPFILFAQEGDKYEKRSNKFIKTLEKDFKLTSRQKEDLKKLHKETSKTFDDVADDFSTGNSKGKSNTVDKEVDSAVGDVERFVEKEILEEPKAKPKAKPKVRPKATVQNPPKAGKNKNFEPKKAWKANSMKKA